LQTNARVRLACGPPHPTARLGILGHARAHRFRSRPALPRAGPKPDRRRALELLAAFSDHGPLGVGG